MPLSIPIRSPFLSGSLFSCPTAVAAAASDVSCSPTLQKRRRRRRKELLSGGHKVLLLSRTGGMFFPPISKKEEESRFRNHLPCPAVSSSLKSLSVPDEAQQRNIWPALFFGSLRTGTPAITIWPLSSPWSSSSCARWTRANWVALPGSSCRPIRPASFRKMRKKIETK